MKLTEIKNENSSSKMGTYAGVRFDDETKTALSKYIKNAKISNPLQSSDFHTTVLYSRKLLPNYNAAGNIDPPFIGTPIDFVIWKGQDENNCLVLTYDCPKLVERHKELMKEHKATYDFPKYQPHITLSYDFDATVKSLPDITSFLPKITIIEEYQEELNLDWAKEKTTN